MCISFVGIDASQLYHYSMCQRMLTGLYTRCDLNPHKDRFTPTLNKTRNFENMVMSYFQRRRPQSKMKETIKQADRRKLTASMLLGFVLIAALCLKPWVVLTTFFLVKKRGHPSLKSLSNVVVKKERLINWDDDTVYKKKASRSIECGCSKNRDCRRQALVSKNMSQKTFFTGIHLKLSKY